MVVCIALFVAVIFVVILAVVVDVVVVVVVAFVVVAAAAVGADVVIVVIVAVIALVFLLQSKWYADGGASGWMKRRGEGLLSDALLFFRRNSRAHPILPFISHFLLFLLLLFCTSQLALSLTFLSFPPFTSSHSPMSTSVALSANTLKLAIPFGAGVISLAYLCARLINNDTPRTEYENEEVTKRKFMKGTIINYL
jgi:hypothetical protein